MTYSDNNRDWCIGQLVIQRGDAKRPDLLMHVIAIERDIGGHFLSIPEIIDDKGKFDGNIYVTEYIHPSKIKKIGKKYVKREVYRNRKEIC
jgi:hypothetical protein